MKSPLETGSVDCLQHEGRKFPPSWQTSANAHIKNLQQYEKMYRRSIDESDAFWLDMASSLDWIKRPTVGCQYEWNTAQRKVRHTWFEDGKLNVSINCLDRHLLKRRDQMAIIWQGDSDEETQTYTYGQLHMAVCRLANAMKTCGIQKGDRVCIYLPLIPEAAIAMLACARIGAIHAVVFGGFSAESLAHRIQDSGAKMLITANFGMRGGKKLLLKEICDTALSKCNTIETTIVVQRTSDPCTMGKKDRWYHEIVADQPAYCPPETMMAEDPLFILHTSGSTGKPKGVVHTQGGYLLHASLTHRYIFDIHENDVYWCSADIGWITGHSYVVYGPLANGCTTVLFEGTPAYPDFGRYWQVIEKYKVNIFYTAPTAIRAAISKGDDYPKKYNMQSLRLLGSVGEPINPEVWLWYRNLIGQGKCPVMDTWWQTETGGILITPLPGSHTLKPGSASKPFFGVDPVILRENASICAPFEGGSLCIRKPWPGMMRTLWNDHERFINTYFSAFPNVYFSGDGCHVDDDGDYWLLGRMDDIANVSGHRIGTAEVESAIVSHPSVAEAAVVPVSDAIKGQKLFAFITLIDGVSKSEDLKLSVAQHVRKEIGSIAVPDKIQFAAGLPKTRSGKIMRRILRKIAEKNTSDLGDITTLADPAVVEALIKGE
ncbi:MAG: Acs [Parachlamydiales bacterium]|nr:Acs [Parachlamydiales bacterium]